MDVPQSLRELKKEIKLCDLFLLKYNILILMINFVLLLYKNWNLQNHKAAKI